MWHSLDASSAVLGDPVSEVGGPGVNGWVEISTTWWVGPWGYTNQSPCSISTLPAHEWTTTVTLNKRNSRNYSGQLYKPTCHCPKMKVMILKLDTSIVMCSYGNWNKLEIKGLHSKHQCRYHYRDQHRSCHRKCHKGCQHKSPHNQPGTALGPELPEVCQGIHQCLEISQ